MKITVGNETREIEEGISLSKIADAFSVDGRDRIILAKVNGKLQEMFKNCYWDSTIEFLDITDNDARRTYIRGVLFVMLAAVNACYGMQASNEISVEHSLGTGIYCKKLGEPVTQEFIDTVKAKMQEYVAANRAIEKKSMNKANAVRLFRENGMDDKVRLLRYRCTSKVNVYCMSGYTDYFYGYMPASTGVLKLWDIVPYEDGLMVLMPDTADGTTVPPAKNSDKFFRTLQKSNTWGSAVGIELVGDLNDCIASGGAEDLILVQESLLEKRVAEIAEMIRSSGGKKFVMIAGPSSSGKTSFSHRLSIQLRTHGFKPHPIALDNYYRDREFCPKDEYGNYDFECLEALDIELFNKQMTQLLNGERVEMPEFNFKTGKPEYKGNFMQLGPEDILVIEGIHGLNDRLSYSLPAESKFRIYISALTEINIDRHNRIPTTDVRLIRRIVRDARARGTSATETIAMWYSVRRGEEKNIFPYQESADVMYNSAAVYELAVLKTYIEPLLYGVPEDSPEYLEANRLLKMLSYILAMPSESVPHNAILREFIGGSVFRV
ncbi:MAG: nucleoside kinase [Lachnospiraceae bacterium]|nr:nucleoside kinase [Lachnospiraceae bacterium]